MSSLSNSDPVPHVRRSSYLRKVLTRDPFELWRLLRITLLTARFRFLQGCIGKGTVVGIGTQIVNAANVRIGRDCLLQDHVYLRAGTQGSIHIGDRAALNSFCRMFGHGSIEIGEDTQLGPGVTITTTGHNILGNLEASFQRVVIGKRVWIGANATILPGVHIGDHAVIGAGSLVNKDIPPSTLAVGVPARVIKELSL